MRNRETSISRGAGWALLWTGVVLLAGPAEAQRWGRPSEPRNGVCFYRDPGFRGDYFCSAVGEEIASVPYSMSGRIASIRTFGDAEVTLFQNSRFGGHSTSFDFDVEDLEYEGWDHRVSSLRVMRNSSDRGNRRGDARRDRRSEVDPDRIVRRAYQDILEREPDTPGLRLYRSRIIDDGWTEEKVREALRKSPEYREKTTMTLPKAREIVKKAYLAVLDREPDAGSKGYVDNVLKDKWTQQDVERELRKSAEYRNKKE